MRCDRENVHLFPISNESRRGHHVQLVYSQAQGIMRQIVTLVLLNQTNVQCSKLSINARAKQSVLKGMSFMSMIQHAPL